MNVLRIFVYGTLKRGGSNYARHCGGATEVEEAWVWGRLRIFANRYPLLCIPREHVLAIGTADYAADVARGATPLAPPSGASLPSDWRRVRGEMMTFTDGVSRLPRLDALENFSPPGAFDDLGEPAAGLHAHFGYERVLAPVYRNSPRMDIDSGDVLAWTYVCPPGFEERFPLFDDDVWDERTWRDAMRRNRRGS